MAITAPFTTLVINGVDYPYPLTGSSDWGQAASAWAIAVSSGLLQKSGGLFTLTSEVNFGNSFGLKSLYFKSNTLNTAVAGTLRLAASDSINFRNSANTGDHVLNTISDILCFDGVPVGSGGGGGGGGLPIIFNYVGDGVETEYSITGATLSSSVSYFVFIDGVEQSPNTDYSVDINTELLTFTTAPPNLTNIEIRTSNTIVDIGGEPLDFEFTGNGVQVTFPISGAVISVANGYFVFIDGIQLNPDDYIIDSTNDLITFDVAPANLSNIIVRTWVPLSDAVDAFALRLQNGTSTTTVAGSLITGPLLSTVLKYDRTAAEISAGVTPANYNGTSRPWVDAVERYGFVGDGVTDNTTAMTDLCAVDGQACIFRAGVYTMGKFTPPENSFWILEPGVVFDDKGSLGVNDRFMNLTNDNITIIGYGAIVQETRADYMSGEQRHGVFIFEAENITIEGLESNSCGGDGFYIGGTSIPSTNIKLINCSADNNRRQGLSIVNAIRVRVIDNTFTNTGVVNGTAPSAGFDIEPNGPTNFLNDIQVIRPRCVGNAGPGIEIFLNAWNSVSNYVDVVIENPYTENNGSVSQSGRLRPGIDINRISSATPCRGRIKILNPVCMDEKQAGIHIYDWDINGPNVIIENPVVINPNQANGSASNINGGIIFHNSGTFTSTPGNIRIFNSLVRDDDGLLFSNSLGVGRINGKWRDVVISNPTFSYAGANPWVISADACPTINSVPEIFAQLTGNTTITDGRYLGRTIGNLGAAGTINITLPQTTSDMIGWQLAFEVFAAFPISIIPNAADKIVPVANDVAGGSTVSSTIIGSRITIECRQVGYWNITSQTLGWQSASATTPTFAVTNLTTDRAMDCNTALITEVCDVLGTLIRDLQRQGIVIGTAT